MSLLFIEWQWSEKSSKINGMTDWYLNFIAANEIIISIYRKYMWICQKSVIKINYTWFMGGVSIFYGHHDGCWQSKLALLSTHLPRSQRMHCSLEKSVNAIDFYLYIVNNSLQIQQWRSCHRMSLKTEQKLQSQSIVFAILSPNENE